MQSFILPLITGLWRRYIHHDVSHQAAALAYFLLFSLFPLLILASSFLRFFDLSGILSTLSRILPARFLTLVENYLNFAANHSGRSLVSFSVIFSVWFPMRSTDCLMHAVRRAYGLSEPHRRLRHRCKVLLYTILLLLSITLTALLVTLSQSIAAAFAALLGLPEEFATLWGVCRFLVLGLVMFGALSILYATAQDARIRLSAILPGALLSTLAWIALSAVYSFYTEYISNYDLIYGTLSTVAIVLIWLYLSAIALIMGAELNAALSAIQKTNT